MAAAHVHVQYHSICAASEQLAAVQGAHFQAEFGPTGVSKHGHRSFLQSYTNTFGLLRQASQ